LPHKESFKPSKLSLTTNLTLSLGQPARLVVPTDQTGRPGFFDYPCLNNFSYQHIAPIFSKACILKNTSIPKLLRSMARHRLFVFSYGRWQYICLYYSSILPYTCVIFFQVSTIKSSRKVLASQRLQHIRISSDYLHNCIWSFPTQKPLSKFMILGTDRQNDLPN
jgi:hypothetical protein